jgi:hypothetical protein
MLQAARAVHTDETKTSAGRHVAAKGYVHKAALRITKALDAVTARVNSEVGRLEKLLQGPPAPSDAKALAICLGLHRLSDSDRRKLVLESVAEGDDTAAAVVLNSSRIATGLSAIELSEAVQGGGPRGIRQRQGGFSSCRTCRTNCKSLDRPSLASFHARMRPPSLKMRSERLRRQTPC